MDLRSSTPKRGTKVDADSSRDRRRRWLALPAAAVAILTIVLAPSAARAEAVTVQPQAQTLPAQMVKAPMQVDCVKTTGSALKDAIAKGFCAADGGPTTQTIATGNCGWSGIFPVNAGGGRATIGYGFGSSLGPVIFRSLVVTWVNISGPTGAFSDVNVQASSTYSATRTVATGAGSVLAQLSGSVTLWYGTICTVLSPIDVTPVT
jgi:hypothetical protein